VQAAGATSLASLQIRADTLVSARTGEQTLQKGAQVEARASDDERDASSMGDGTQRLAGSRGVVAGSEEFGGLDDIDQVMWNAAPLFQCQFGGTDIEVPVYLQRVATYYLAGKAFGDAQAKLSLT
jgi:hypothetical protein